jgi:hypothetical protein
MTTYKFFSFFVLLSLISCAVAAQTSAKTFNKSFNTEGKETLVFDLPGAIDLKVWNNPTIKIEMSVSLPSANPAMLNELANIGRYNMVSRTEGDKWLVSIPTLQKQIKLKGEVLKEVLSFVVFVPKDMKVEMLNNQLAEAKK